ncbi:hypothetical protein Tsubulata_026054 [Turnera subulata]|uniref:Uncharacterized protein n=1 Tax=Turnera subulata TaxID=218843 RepID=A0A9Q0JJ63_9ROSI|nr:hypothetical protein Tsubulata_026054 [Turnera subulata]
MNASTKLYGGSFRNLYAEEAELWIEADWEHQDWFFNVQRDLLFLRQLACWAMSKSWLDVLVDLELARSQPGRMELLKRYGDGIGGCPGSLDIASHSAAGPENWPLQVLNKQPRNLSALLQKFHSGPHGDPQMIQFGAHLVLVLR